MVEDNDTSYLFFSDKTNEVVLLNAKSDTINLPYTIQSNRFLSESKNTLNGWFLRSKTIAPTVSILFLHGNGGFLGTQYQAMTRLLEYGFQCFAIDYSGYGFSTGRVNRRKTLQDGNTALEKMLSMPEVEGTKIVIYGQSLGGHLAAVVAKMNEEKIDGLVTEGAFSSHKDIAKVFAGNFGKAFVKELYSAKDSIALFHKPVLIIHSTEDEVVPFYMGENLFEKANAPKQFYAIDSCHICGSTIYAKEIAQKIHAMLQKVVLK